MIKKAEIERTTPALDGISSPLASAIIRFATEHIFGQVELVPTFLSKLPYRTGMEEHAIEILSKSQKLNIDPIAKQVINEIQTGDYDKANISEKLSGTILQVVQNISNATGIDENISKEMLINRACLEKWIRAITVLSLAQYGSGNDEWKADIRRSIVRDVLQGETSNARWNGWKRRDDLTDALSYGGRELTTFLQAYVDNFDLQ